MSDKQVANEQRLLKVILGPLVTEKTANQTEKSNQYAFKVLNDATKYEVKKAVELLFNVTVEAVSVINVKGKQKRFGQMMGRRSDSKKAYVRLQNGQSIDFMGQELGA